MGRRRPSTGSGDRYKPPAVRKRQRIGLYIVLATSGIFLLTILVIAGISYNMYEEAFYNYSNELALSSNAQAAYVIDGDLVERFSETLAVDEQYRHFAIALDGLRDHIDAANFYIMADTGMPGRFTYIYDAAYGTGSDGQATYALGKTENKAFFPGGQEVLTSGKGFERAQYYADEEAYGEVYYAYAPIYNTEGMVVAFVGTDIDIQPMHAELNSYRAIITWVVIGALVVFAVVCLMIVQRILSFPLQGVMDVATHFAAGDLNLRLSSALEKRNDEIGQLAGTFRSMAGSMSAVIEDTEHIMKAVRNGYLGDRIQLTGYRGDYFRIISGINATLDVVSRHFNAVPEGIAFFGPDKVLHYQNQAMGEINAAHGFNPMGEAYLDGILAGAAEAESLAPQVEALFGGAQAALIHADILLPAGDGEQHVYAMTLLRTDIAESQPLGAVEKPRVSSTIMLLLSDISPLVQARNAAISASRAKSEFLSRMSHEIRTPMNAIIGLSQIALNADDLQKVKGYLQRVEASSAHLLGVINDILDFSKIEAGKLVLEEALFSLRGDLDFVQTLMAPRARERGLTIAYHADSIVHDGIVADSLRLNQVLINLLSNAIKFSHEGGTIVVTVAELGHEAGESVYRFAVRDHGIGIEQEKSERLFEPFEQADAGVTRQYGGTGLGLAISRNIVELMGGAIGVQSVLGEGSEFAFTIQVRAQAGAEPAQALPEVARSEGHDFSGRRALIVDDIDINREIIEELLRDTGLLMEPAADGQEALSRFEASPVGYYGVILMDMQMPVMDGCTATERIRALDRPDARTVPIIAMTANVLREDVENALAAGMNGHLGKPIDLQAMLRMLEEVLA